MTERERQKVISVFTIVPPRALLLDIAGPMEVLRKANLQQTDVSFTVDYIGPSAGIHTSVGIALAGIAPLPPSIPDDALVVISGSADEPLGGIYDDRSDDATFEEEIVEWLRRTIRPDTRLVTICSGALLAARAGLLDGYECTTHHATIEALRRSAPRARVLENRLYVEDRYRLTSAGITAGIDLMLAIVAREVGHPTALAIARYLVVYMRRGPADPQLSPWLEGRNHIHPSVHRAQDAIAADPSRSWSVEMLATVAATSPRNLSRLFNEQTGMSVIDYVNRMRIALAKEMVVGSRLDMESIAERSGFASTRQFRRAWGRLHDAPPARMRAVSGSGGGQQRSGHRADELGMATPEP
ncbi:GlxA family transcriptional regulator [Pararhizobium qamdonense]|uniref:GlxA family transcriptional regulator n=1 Tax=Pararhizobium qamdonense TaxID=3031126 RepID=UPI0023E25624|nr:helix-turn-helix domain-containing protein [Pararhizobium qamdonense]